MSTLKTDEDWARMSREQINLLQAIKSFQDMPKDQWNEADEEQYRLLIDEYKSKFLST